MPIKVYRRKGSLIYSYRGTVAGRRLRGSAGTTDKIRAEQIAAQKEADEWKCRLDGPQAVLTFAKAAILYRRAGKEVRYLERIEDYWKNTLVRDMTAGAIRQSAIDICPEAGNACPAMSSRSRRHRTRCAHTGTRWWLPLQRPTRALPA
jgi:hypothetical protein